MGAMLYEVCSCHVTQSDVIGQFMCVHVSFGACDEISSHSDPGVLTTGE